MKRIYLDNAAATPIDPRVQKEIIRGLSIVGNPSSFNDPGREAFSELQKARLAIARFLGAHDDEIVFTSSGSEANSLAIFGLAEKSGAQHRHIVTTPIEHKSVLEPVQELSGQGFRTHMLNVDRRGIVDLVDLKKNLTPTTLLVSIMYANNEIGTIQPIVSIGKMIKAFRKAHRTPFPLFHIDACQALECCDMNADRLGADMITGNGSKIYGPRGVGFLYVRRGTALASQVLGGGQERGLRAGTENLPGILGLAKAISLIKPKGGEKIRKLRDYFFGKLPSIIPDAVINGVGGADRLPNNINISIPHLSSETLLVELDAQGISAGSGSACTARSVEPSHVLKAIGVKAPYLEGALRFSLGRDTAKKDIDHLVNALPKIVQSLKRRYSPK